MMNGYRPQNISELKQVLKEMDPKGKMIAGGTDEVIQMHTFHRIPSELVYLGAIPELREIREEENSIFVGACCTHHMVAENELVKKHAGALHDACSDIGSPQIRNNGTIGGNIANASPAGDGLPVMWLLDPEIEILGPDGTRMTRMKNLLLGPGKTSLDYNEVIVGFHIRKRPENVINHFHKLGFRKRVTIARIGMAVELTMDQDTVADVTVIVGAISLTPKECEGAEKAIIGTKLEPEKELAAAKAVSDLIMEITPEKFDRDYKVWSSRGAVSDVLDMFR